MVYYIFDIPKEEMKKYDIILNYSTDELKNKLQELAFNYYNSYLNNDSVAFNEVTEEINKYLELDVPEIESYFKYASIIVINEILKNIYGSDLKLYVPEEPSLIFKTKHDLICESYIKKEELTEDEVELIKQYNIEAMEVHALQMAGIKYYSVEPSIKLPNHLKKSMLLTVNYVGLDNEDSAILSSAKLGVGFKFICSDKLKKMVEAENIEGVEF